MPTNEEHIAAERELAELLGWRDLEVLGEGYGAFLAGSNNGRPRTCVPRWSKDVYPSYVVSISLGVDTVGLSPYECVQACIRKLKIKLDAK